MNHYVLPGVNPVGAEVGSSPNCLIVMSEIEITKINNLSIKYKNKNIV